MGLHDEYRAALAILHTPGIGARTWKRLAESYPSLTDAARDAGNWHAKGLARRAQSDAFRRKEWRLAAGREYDAAKAFGSSVIVWHDAQYPARLKDISDPPLRLYYQGDLALTAGPCVAMVGTRRCSTYGLDMARRFGAGLSAAGICIVSGMAMGIDREAHLAGLDGPGCSIGVLGTGLDRIYPSSNADVYRKLAHHGLLVSEYPPGMEPDAHNFPVRNRIISGLSMAVLVVEAGLSSGSLITARQAADQGRDVFAVPGPLDQPGFVGCNSLLSDGAILALTPEDVIYHLGSQLVPLADSAPVARELHHTASLTLTAEPNSDAVLRPDVGTPKVSASLGPADDSISHHNSTPFQAKIASPTAHLSSVEQAVMDQLGDERLHIDELGRKAGLSSAAVGRTLVSLEIRGLVRQWAGMLFSRS